MRILIIGGTRFIGYAILRELLGAGHEVLVFHRGIHPLQVDETVGTFREFLADRKQLHQWVDAIGSIDGIVDTCAMTGEHVQDLERAYGKGQVPVTVVLSSIDVYRAFQAVHTGFLDEPVPLTEQSALRQPKRIFADEGAEGSEHDNLEMELALKEVPDLNACVLRLAVVYGPRDYRRREWPWIGRVLDQRTVLPMAEGWLGWLVHRTFVKDVALAVRLCLEQPQKSAGQVFNVGEPDCLPWTGLVQAVTQAAGGTVEIIPVDQELLPAHLNPGPYSPQPLLVSTHHIRQTLGFKESADRLSNLKETVQWHLKNPPPLDETTELPDYAAEQALLSRLAASRK